MLVSMVEYYLMPSNWLRWMKLVVIKYTWNLLLIAFSINFPNMLRRTIGKKAFKVL